MTVVILTNVTSVAPTSTSAFPKIWLQHTDKAENPLPSYTRQWIFALIKTAILCYKPYSAALVFTSISYDGIAQQ